MKFCSILFLLLFSSYSAFSMDLEIKICERSPLHKAARKGDIIGLRKVLAAGITEYIHDEWGLVEIRDYKGKAVLDLKDSRGETALHIAARQNYTAATNLLIE